MDGIGVVGESEDFFAVGTAAVPEILERDLVSWE